jgi:hypothetical protein
MRRFRPLKSSSRALVIALQGRQVIIGCILRRPGSRLGSSADRFLDYFETSRRKRNIIDYDYAFVATDTEAEEILTEAKAFIAFVEEWIGLRYPSLAKS